MDFIKDLKSREVKRRSRKQRKGKQNNEIKIFKITSCALFGNLVKCLNIL